MFRRSRTSFTLRARAIRFPTSKKTADLSDEDKQVFLADMGMKEPGLNRLIRTGYALLGLQIFVRNDWRPVIRTAKSE